MTAKNGKQIGQEHLSTLESYFAGGGALPISPRDGTLNLTELARTTGIPKSSFYQNAKVKERLEAARQAQNVSRQGERQAADGTAASLEAPSKLSKTASTVQLERQMQRLEQQNAVLVAENYELRRQLKAVRLQMGREDMTIETARRVPGPEVGG